MDLPRGFTYEVFSRTGETMDDGLLVPTNHDGMAAFAGRNGRIVLVRSHQLSENSEKELGPYGENNRLLSLSNSSLVYDPGQGSPPLAATVTLVYDPNAQRLVRHFVSLAGVLRISTGGATPWGSWVCCEESSRKAGGRFEKDHGFNFEVAATEIASRGSNVPLKAMGRFTHEGAALHIPSGIVYQTEDRTDGLIYRFIPAEPGRLARGGRLQALMLRDLPSADTRNHPQPLVQPGQSMAVRWIDLEDIESPNDDLRLQGFAKGAAVFTRGEGMAIRGDQLFFNCKDGGLDQAGQIWRYTVSPSEGTSREEAEPGRLQLFLEPNDRALLENPDNLTISPWGDLIACEDGDAFDFLIGVTPQGGLFQFARNVQGFSEFAGATFSPDGRILFVNMQRPGMTLAIRGPWQKRATWAFHRARAPRRRR